MSPSFKPKKPSNLRSVVLSREQLYEAPPARRRFRSLFFSSILKKQGRQAEAYLERQFSQLNKSRVRGSLPICRTLRRTLNPVNNPTVSFRFLLHKKLTTPVLICAQKNSPYAALGLDDFVAQYRIRITRGRVCYRLTGIEPYKSFKKEGVQGDETQRFWWEYEEESNDKLQGFPEQKPPADDNSTDGGSPDDDSPVEHGHLEGHTDGGYEPGPVPSLRWTEKITSIDQVELQRADSYIWLRDWCWGPDGQAGILDDEKIDNIWERERSPEPVADLDEHQSSRVLDGA